MKFKPWIAVGGAGAVLLVVVLLRLATATPTTTVVAPPSSVTSAPAELAAAASATPTARVATPSPPAPTSAPTSTSLPLPTATPTASVAATAASEPSSSADTITVTTPLPGAATTPPAASPTVPAPSTDGAVPPAPGVEATLRYVFPVRAARVDYGPAHHDYPAADMFCAVGSEFVAPVDGVVDFVSREDVWDPQTNKGQDRGGLSVALVGDDGVRYYGSHLSAVADGIEPGSRVVAGQVLGLTGNSGNARSTPPHLHFGISRPTTPEDWQVRRGEIAPYPYLQAWERGETLSPAPQVQP